MRPFRWAALVAGSLILVPFVPATALATEPTVLVATLAPAVEDPAASPSPTATGSATFTIDPDRGVIRYRVVYANTRRQVTLVALCAGAAEGRTYPIPSACAFMLVPALPGGASPIEGSAPIDPAVMDGLLHAGRWGWSNFVRLISPAGSELSGYLGPLPATDAAASSAPSPSDTAGSMDRVRWLLPVVVGLIVALGSIGAGRDHRRAQRAGR